MRPGWLYVAVPSGPTFALEIDAAGWCVEAPPVARWCVGKSSGELISYWRRRRGALVLALVDSVR